MAIAVDTAWIASAIAMGIAVDTTWVASAETAVGMLIAEVGFVRHRERQIVPM